MYIGRTAGAEGWTWRPVTMSPTLDRGPAPGAYQRDDAAGRTPPNKDDGRTRQRGRL